MPAIDIEIPAPHRGQAAIMAEVAGQLARYICVRCGRRYGKTTMGVVLALQTMTEGEPVGWFAPTYELFTLGWDELTRILGPIITQKQANYKRFTIVGGGTFQGFSLDTDDPGRGHKFKRVIIDEAGLCTNLGSQWRLSIRPTLLDFEGSDAWFLGTPKASGPDFNDLFRKGENAERGWASFKGKTRDNPHLPNIDEELAEARKSMPEWEYLQEFEGEPAVGDNAFFSLRVIEHQKALHGADPIVRGWIEFPDMEDGIDIDYRLAAKKLDGIRFREDPDRGPWELWFDPGRRRPDQSRPYAAGFDLGFGVGASNSVGSFGDAESGEKLAQFTSSGIMPEDFGRQMAIAGYWFGGRNGSPLFAPELTGPGQSMVGLLRRIKYNRIIQPYEEHGKVDRKPQQVYGWQSTAPAKRALLEAYRAAMADGRFVNHCRVSLDECLTYYETKLGTITCQQEIELRADTTGVARTPHGDHVIADALLWLAMRRSKRVEIPKQTPQPGSIMWHKQREQAKQKRQW